MAVTKRLLKRITKLCLLFAVLVFLNKYAIIRIASYKLRVALNIISGGVLLAYLAINGLTTRVQRPIEKVNQDCTILLQFTSTSPLSVEDYFGALFEERIHWEIGLVK